MSDQFKIISAGAGSGKTYRLTQEMVALLQERRVNPAGIIATTFTNAAAAELRERVRTALLRAGMPEAANDLSQAFIGTVHSLGEQLLTRFAFEAGVSPQVSNIADDEQQDLFNQSLATVLTEDRVRTMETLSMRLGLNKTGDYSWRKEVLRLTEVARTNDFSQDDLEKSKHLSWNSFAAFLPPVSDRPAEAIDKGLAECLKDTLNALENSNDSTGLTNTAADVFRSMLLEIEQKGELQWHQWVKIAKQKTGVKSQGLVEDLRELAWTHETHPRFRDDLRQFTFQLFDIAILAINEYERYKKQRGLIDYTDMEVSLKRLIDHPACREVLQDELELLMVDEFQDTSPIQLEIFLKLSRIARYSVWVGDPKQSIYGFRGADPGLMQSIIEQNGGIRPEDVQRYSFRSRQDLVHAVNAIFSQAFTRLPEAQIALEPRRLNGGEPAGMRRALQHWEFRPEDGKSRTNHPWFTACIAHQLRDWLATEPLIAARGDGTVRPARPGDVAILCRTNNECLDMAEALHNAGLHAAVSRKGLLRTAEARLVLACLKYLLNRADSLSAAEILLLTGQMPIEAIVEDRLAFLEELKQTGNGSDFNWAADNAFIGELNKLRGQIADLSGTETLNLVLESLDLRRLVAAWPNASHRLDNVDVLRRFALEYEEACNRLHAAASLGGLLLWFSRLEREDKDDQAPGLSDNAVNVVTYHRSKGLEWPVVICHSLENKLRDSLFGIALESETPAFDPANPLGNRWLRFWANPYADQQQNTPLLERLQNSEAGKTARRSALEEEARLLYVGLTRARDYLVFPTRGDGTRWLNRVCNHGDENVPSLNPDSEELNWMWKERVLPVECSIRVFPRDIEPVALPAAESRYFPPRAGKSAPRPPAQLTAEEWGRPFSFRVAQAVALHALPDAPDSQQAARILHSFLLAETGHLPADSRKALLLDLLEQAALHEAGLEDRLLECAAAFEHFLLQTFHPTASQYSYPVRWVENQRRYSGSIDRLLDTPAGWVVVLLQADGADPASKGPALHLAKKVLEQVSGKMVAGTWVYALHEGRMAEITST